MALDTVAWRQSTLVMLGLGERMCEMEHAEANAVLHTVGREGAQRPGNDSGHGAPLLGHGEHRG